MRVLLCCAQLALQLLFLWVGLWRLSGVAETATSLDAHQEVVRDKRGPTSTLCMQLSLFVGFSCTEIPRFYVFLYNTKDYALLPCLLLLSSMSALCYKETQ